MYKRQEIGDKEFVGYLKDAKAKLLDEVYPTRNEEYAELFGVEVVDLVALAR